MNMPVELKNTCFITKICRFFYWPPLLYCVYRHWSVIIQSLDVQVVIVSEISFVVGQETDNWKYFFLKWQKSLEDIITLYEPLRISGNSIQSSLRFSADKKEGKKRKTKFVPKFRAQWAPRNGATNIKFKNAQFQAII